jgi:hypothetical protein
MRKPGPTFSLLKSRPLHIVISATELPFYGEVQTYIWCTHQGRSVRESANQRVYYVQGFELNGRLGMPVSEKMYSSHQGLHKTGCPGDLGNNAT